MQIVVEVDMRGDPLELTETRRTLRFSVDGGPFIQADVSLSASVWPWVQMTWEGDAVTIVSIEQVSDDEP